LKNNNLTYNSNDTNVNQKNTLIPALTLSYFSTYMLDFIVGIFLLDVTFTFFGSKDAVSVALTSQISTISSAIAVIVGITIAILSIRFQRKKLLMIGALCIPIGIVGCILAPNITTMAIFYPFDGIGSVIVGSMIFALAGESLPLSKRGKALGIIVSGATWAQFIGAILIRYFFPAGDWRMFLSFYALPVSIIALIFVYFAVPSKPQNTHDNEGKIEYKTRFKEIFLNKSATSCLIGNMMRHAGMIWGIVYGATFFRLTFEIPLATYALYASIGTLLFAIGNITGGRIVDKVGRKRQVLIAFTLVGIFIAASVTISIMAIAITFSLLSNLLGGIGSAGSLNMTVEQVKAKRGTIMSMSTVFVTLGATLGTAVGGAVLAITANYQILAFTYISFTLIAAAIYLIFTKDPCIQTIKTQQENTINVSP
jgi:MFS transporter, DHA1 family, inner membrane transport protein